MQDATVNAKGPYALIHYKNGQIAYLRDRLGRRSLLHHLVGFRIAKSYAIALI